MNKDEQTHPFDYLTPDTVMDAVESCGFNCDARVLGLNSYENRVYQVGLDDTEPVIAKFYRPERWTSEQIQEEHEFSLELDDLELPVVPPMIINGTSLQVYEGFRFALFKRRGGRSPEFDNLNNMRIMGRFLGRMHRAGAAREFKYRYSLSIQRFGEDSMNWLLTHNFIPPELEEAYASLAVDLIKKMKQIVDRNSWQELRIHGDCHMGNVLWRDDQPNFVDFDDTMQGPAIQDLWMLLSGDRIERQSQLSVLLAGYNEFHTFRAAELQFIETLRTLRLMHYSAWLARRWHDPAFPLNFPWFNTQNYWASHILELREQLAALDEPPLEFV